MPHRKREPQSTPHSPPHPAANPVGTPRERLQAEMVAAAKEDLHRYYDEHRDRFGDARSQDAVRVSMKGLERLFALMDKYEIADKPCP